MADQKITALTEETAPVAADLAAIVDDVAGTPVTKKSTLANIVGKVLSTTGVFNTGSIELGHASDTTLARIAAGRVSIEGEEIATPDNVLTLTNKRITSRVQSVASAATVTPNLDDDDVVIITGQAEGLTLANMSGTGTQGQKMIVRIKDNGTTRSISYGVNYRAIGVTLPTDTTANKTIYLGIINNTTDSKHDIVAVASEE